MLVLIENEVLYSALLLGGVYHRDLRSAVVMNAVNQLKERVYKNNTLTRPNNKGSLFNLEDQ